MSNTMAPPLPPGVPRVVYRSPDMSEADWNKFLIANRCFVIISGNISRGQRIVRTIEQRTAAEQEAIHEQHRRTDHNGVDPFKPRPKSQLIEPKVVEKY